jgi:hypothetical protein
LFDFLIQKAYGTGCLQLHSKEAVMNEFGQLWVAMLSYILMIGALGFACRYAYQDKKWSLAWLYGSAAAVSVAAFFLQFGSKLELVLPFG